MRPTEVKFVVTEAPDGGYDARAVGDSIFTQGEDWNDLKQMVRDAVLCHFGEDKAPQGDRIELLPVRRIGEMQGFLAGMDPRFEREPDHEL